MKALLTRAIKAMMPELHEEATAVAEAVASARPVKSEGYAPVPGYAFNPLRGKHRNTPCPCGSGQKAKRCCGRFPVLPEAVARAVSRVLK
jgi:uncharacterized protein YecA (UPF0149 family)